MHTTDRIDASSVKPTPSGPSELSLSPGRDRVRLAAAMSRHGFDQRTRGVERGAAGNAALCRSEANRVAVLDAAPFVGKQPVATETQLVRLHVRQGVDDQRHPAFLDDV